VGTGGGRSVGAVRRAVAAIVLLAALAAVLPAGAGAEPAAAPGPGGAGAGTVTTPEVGFRPLLAPWWVRRVAREVGDRRTLTALYLADGGTPETGRGFALVRTRAVDGAALCGASTAPLGLRAGPFARADVVQTGDTIVVRRANVRAGTAVTMAVARGLTLAEVRDVTAQLRVVRNVVAPRTIPNDLHLVGLAPVDATLTGGPGTVVDLVGGISSDRTVALHAAVARGPALDAARFFRATSVGMACTPDRYQVQDLGNALVAATSSGPGDAASVAGMLRRTDATGYAQVVGWARRPGPTQLARRCKGLGPMVTLAGENHGRVWGVGLTEAADGATCVAGPSGGTPLPAPAGTPGPVRVRVRRHDTCGLLLVAGNAPPRTRRLVVRSGSSNPQRGHLRLLGVPANSTALWAAYVRTAAVTDPPVTVTAYDRREKTIARIRLPAGSSAPCRRGRRT
jgi:hypothetical protein